MSKSSITASGHTLWSKMPKANTELFALTYGSLITELLKDYDNDIEEINNQLERIGHSIGIRCIDELLAKSEVNGIDIGPCSNLENTAEVVAKIGFRCFLGMTCDVANVTEKSFSLFLYENPLSIFVELPETTNGDDDDRHQSFNSDGKENSGGGPDWSKLKYSNVYCGVIRGALEQINMKVECDFVRDVLRGHDVNEIKVELKEIMSDGAGQDYHEE
mmetsp:Transcript_17447/g.21308  ORF Transcript_17447/g.21308 Transcript_17447/m.21308 type:complete len:218 (-) Transcript_17447:38-691(-)